MNRKRKKFPHPPNFASTNTRFKLNTQQPGNAHPMSLIKSHIIAPYIKAIPMSKYNIMLHLFQEAKRKQKFPAPE